MPIGGNTVPVRNRSPDDDRPAKLALPASARITTTLSGACDAELVCHRINDNAPGKLVQLPGLAKLEIPSNCSRHVPDGYVTRRASAKTCTGVPSTVMDVCLNG